MTHYLTPLLLAAALSTTTTTTATAADQAKDVRLYELRTYHAEPGKLNALLTRFRDHTTKLFANHGMTNIGYWVPVDNKDNLLVYLLAYPDRSARDASWAKFLADPEWKNAAAASEKDGSLVAKIDQLFLTATDFSPGFSAATGPGERLFEMRTYTSPAGKLPALHNRFRNHTLALFAKHGLTNIGYFQPVADQPAAGETLLYFLAHKDAAAAQKSWEAFRADPAWVAAKNASEEAAGGSLTVADGIVSIYLKPTDFSPVK
ncbi:MAG: NIPSNAP family protein [Verrucomicrobia bacterium]|nr:MAG: NIPSNAP family protein [Verrucomicrobiota bacterium]